MAEISTKLTQTNSVRPDYTLATVLRLPPSSVRNGQLRAVDIWPHGIALAVIVYHIRSNRPSPDKHIFDYHNKSEHFIHFVCMQTYLEFSIHGNMVMTSRSLRGEQT